MERNKCTEIDAFNGMDRISGVELISSNSSDQEWLVYSTNLLAYLERASTLHSTLSQLHFPLVSQKLCDMSEQWTFTNGDSSVAHQIANNIVHSLRIILRSREPLDQERSRSIMQALCSLIIESQSIDLMHASTRCMVNLVYECADRANLFWTECVNGENAIIHVLANNFDKLGGLENGSALQLCAVKLVFMMFAQNPALSSDRLSPHTETALQVTEAAGKCLQRTGRMLVRTVNRDGGMVAVEEDWCLYCECAKLLYALGVAEVAAQHGDRGREVGAAVFSTALLTLVGCSASDAEQRTDQQQQQQLLLQGKGQAAEDVAAYSLQLLMYAPAAEVAGAVAEAGTDSACTLERVCRALTAVLQRQLLAAQGLRKASEQAALLIPGVVVLRGLCEHSEAAKAQVKHIVFPNPCSSSGSGGGGGGGDEGSRRMDPEDAPPGTLRWLLLRHMTSLDAHLKRCVAELLFLLCDEDPAEFTARTGFGNAVALLQIKGLC